MITMFVGLAALFALGFLLGARLTLYLLSTRRPESRHLLVLFSAESAVEFNNLQQFTEADPTLLIRRALSTYDQLYRAQAEGRAIVLEGPEGSERVVIP